MGAPLEEVREKLAAIVDRLDGVLGEHAAPLLMEAKRQLSACACRIAVIGQVKVGKSTFTNALMRRPGLLPTHINPWTAVVCSLHVRRSPAPPEHAAVFQLFSAEEWKQLAEGGGHLRQLTERLQMVRGPLTAAAETIAELDSVFARARFAKWRERLPRPQPNAKIFGGEVSW